MLDALYIAATGMHGQQLQVDTIANNLANVSTPAFKRSRVAFDDVMVRQSLSAARLPGAAGALLHGAGVVAAQAAPVQVAGDLKKTELPLDLAVRGEGFFELTRPDGSAAYTRAGAFQLDSEGYVSNAQGLRLAPALQIPPDAGAVTIDAAGVVKATLPGEKEPVELGAIELAGFINPGGLMALGDNLWAPTDASGDAFTGRPGEQKFGAIAQGFLESSNVKLVDEFVNLVVAQRAYEASSKAIQAADDMLAIANALRR